MRGKRSAFTLVELLIVIAVISILAAMLLPAMRNIREHARTVECQNRLKQIHLAVFAYTDDNRRYFPLDTGTSGSTTPPDCWTVNTKKYWGNPANTDNEKKAKIQFLQCPAMKNDYPLDDYWKSNYAMNKYLNKIDNVSPVKAIRMHALMQTSAPVPGSTTQTATFTPSTTLLVTCGSTRNRTLTARTPHPDEPDDTELKRVHKKFSDNRFDETNAIFADGNIKMLRIGTRDSVYNPHMNYYYKEFPRYMGDPDSRGKKYRIEFWGPGYLIQCPNGTGE